MPPLGVMAEEGRLYFAPMTESPSRKFIAECPEIDDDYIGRPQKSIDICEL